MTYMAYMDENWLDRALQEQPAIEDAGFSEHVLNKIFMRQKRRANILMAVYGLGLLLVAWILPWQDIFGLSGQAANLKFDWTLISNAFDMNLWMLLISHGVLLLLALPILFGLWLIFSER